MTDRFHSLTVVLDVNVRDDDAESIINAIRMVKHVQSVTPHVADPTSHMAEERARRELGDKLWKVLYPEKGDS